MLVKESCKNRSKARIGNVCVCACCACMYMCIWRMGWEGQKITSLTFICRHRIHANIIQQELYSVKQSLDCSKGKSLRAFWQNLGGVGELRWMFLINNQPSNNLHELYSFCQTHSINKALIASSKHLPLENYFYETYITDKALGLQYCTFAFFFCKKPCVCRED